MSFPQYLFTVCLFRVDILIDYANALDAGGGLYMHRISGWWCLLQVVKRFYLDLPGTELAFSSAVTVTESRFVVGWKAETLGYATAIFRQVNKDEQLEGP